LNTVYIALGSNLGDRAENLAQARRDMQRREIAMVRESSVYETPPWGYLEQPRFLNQVVEAATDWMPRQLMSHLAQIEREMGRHRTVRNGPRNIDLDILLYGDAIVSAPGLEIPHPRMGERRFVLEPLAELARDLRHPRTGVTIRDMLAAVADQSARRWTPEE
jgi:2-amino-4-hydroxy-6-hydroxymethyldihydropteridine diphosphokinase